MNGLDLAEQMVLDYRAMLTASPPPPADADPLSDLVSRFSAALLDKLRAAERKYGYSDAWTKSDWQSDLTRKLLEHVQKGDPRDVAAYCAFAWHHGWSVSPPADADGWRPTHRHRKGGLYRLLATALIEADLSPCVVYDDADGGTWVRPAAEFNDGRFAPLPAPPAEGEGRS